MFSNGLSQAGGNAMIDFYQIRSPLSQITEERMNRYVGALSEALGEELRRVPIETYLADDADLIVLAPALKEFGEDKTIDGLIRKYGYKGTPHTLECTNANVLKTVWEFHAF